MTSFNVVVDTKRFERRLTKLQREQLPFARSLAANKSAFETQQTMQKSMGLFIDQPTGFTVRAIRYRRGNKESPAAEIFISGDAPKGTPPAKYLTVTRGGRRGQRPSERALTRAGIISSSEGWVPGEALKKNRFGNAITGARMTQILSQIRAFGEEGFQANVTKGSKARGKKKGRKQYFLSRGNSLPRGVYERYGRGQRKARPVLVFVPLPSYRKQFDFKALAAKEARRRFVRAWPAALRRALATARR